MSCYGINITFSKRGIAADSAAEVDSAGAVDSEAAVEVEAEPPQAARETAMQPARARAANFFIMSFSFFFRYAVDFRAGRL